MSKVYIDSCFSITVSALRPSDIDDVVSEMDYGVNNHASGVDVLDFEITEKATVPLLPGEPENIRKLLVFIKFILDVDRASDIAMFFQEMDYYFVSNTDDVTIIDTEFRDYNVRDSK